MKPTKLSELIEAVEFDSAVHTQRVDLQNGCVVRVETSVLSAVEEGDEDAVNELPDWQKPEVEEARAIVADSGERFVAAPAQADFHEYQHMERFIGTVADDGAAEQLWRAIKGKGAFRRFQDAAGRLGVLEQWYRYREAAIKEFVVAWAGANSVPYEDNTKAR